MLTANADIERRDARSTYSSSGSRHVAKCSAKGWKTFRSAADHNLPPTQARQTDRRLKPKPGKSVVPPTPGRCKAADGGHGGLSGSKPGRADRGLDGDRWTEVVRPPRRAPQALPRGARPQRSGGPKTASFLFREEWLTRQPGEESRRRGCGGGPILGQIRPGEDAVGTAR